MLLLVFRERGGVDRTWAIKSDRQSQRSDIVYWHRIVVYIFYLFFTHIWQSRTRLVLTASLGKIRSRQITESDIDAVAQLLTRGFRRQTHKYWLRALDILARHPTPTGLPRYGFMMESDGTPIGVILLISSTIPNANGSAIRCNVSSWYVEPRYRSLATLLISQALKHKDITYLNISPAAHTLPIVEAHGFSRYSNGQFAAFPVLASSHDDNSSARVLAANADLDVKFESADRDLLLAHEKFGCISLWCSTPERAYPFVFLPRVVKGILPCVQLIYCSDISEFVRLARPLGRFLALRGRLLTLIDANGPIPGLVGKYFSGVAPKYFKGPIRPRLGDLAYTEAAMFGL
jgi:hypothetical protein